MRRGGLIYVLLGLVTLGVYWPVTRFSFINYDDPTYVTENAHILPGFTTEGIAWAFGRLAGEQTYWHPITWLSHMLDCQLFGLQPGAHHLVNVLFHIVNALLLFALLKSMTGAIWRSALVAALFAWHPLAVDTVAWVTERKNVLSTFFWLLSSCAYVGYAHRKKCSSLSNKRTAANFYYFLALALFALGLMSKPMLVTFPFVLLLLDFWPLQRWQRGSSPGEKPKVLLLEKLPFLLFAGASAIITLLGHARLGSLQSVDTGSFVSRWPNILMSYTRYLGKVIWPVDLAVFYPYVKHWPLWQEIIAALVLLGFSVLAWQSKIRRPWITFGWLWFLATLVPVIGLVQAGVQSIADRFAYVPMIGLFIMVAWSLPELPTSLRGGRILLAGYVAIILTACLTVTAHQLKYWRNSGTLFEHALQVTSDNYIAHNNLGCVLAQEGKTDAAFAHFQEALRIRPDDAQAHYNTALIFQSANQMDAALTQLHQALAISPNYAQALNNLAWILATQPDARYRNGREALRLAEHASALLGDQDPSMLDTLAVACAEAGDFNRALATANRALQDAMLTGQKDLAAQIRAHLESFQAGRPFRDSPAPVK